MTQAQERPYRTCDFSRRWQSALAPGASSLTSTPSCSVCTTWDHVCQMPVSVQRQTLLFCLHNTLLLCLHSARMPYLLLYFKTDFFYFIPSLASSWTCLFQLPQQGWVIGVQSVFSFDVVLGIQTLNVMLPTRQSPQPLCSP